jgi:signal transduction histidine kinase
MLARLAATPKEAAGKGVKVRVFSSDIEAVAGGRQERIFLYWARPAASLIAFVFFGLLDAATGEVGGVFLSILALTLPAAVLYALAARHYAPASVLAVGLAVDTLLIGAMGAALHRPDLIAIGYFWSIALGAFLVGPRATLAYSMLGAGLTVGVPVAFDFGVGAVTLATNVLLLCLIGGILAVFSRYARAAELELARDRANDAAALGIAERVRSSLALAGVLEAAVDEIGRALHASRCVIRLAPGTDGSMPLYQWFAPGMPELSLAIPPPPVMRVFETADPLVVEDARQADEETREFAAAVHVRSLLVQPVTWHGRVVAIVSVGDTRPRDWREDALPLLARVVPQLGAALAQAELFEQQEEALERLQEVTRLREELVANVSHELRTPLTSTIGFLRTLERTDVELEDEERGRFLTIARTEAERLAVLVNDLLELARLERRAVALKPAPLDVADVVRRALRGLYLPPGRNVQVAVPGGLVAQADADRLLQVLYNLLSNALQHGEGTIAVAAARDNGHVTLEVSDEGSGVPLERVGDLFVPFAWSSDAHGTGLGLAIARGIMDAHGGSLTYRPRQNGRPHAFVVSLRRADTTA